jgi:hypothetical protein
MKHWLLMAGLAAGCSSVPHDGILDERGQEQVYAHDVPEAASGDPADEDAPTVAAPSEDAPSPYAVSEDAPPEPAPARDEDTPEPVVRAEPQPLRAAPERVLPERAAPERAAPEYATEDYTAAVRDWQARQRVIRRFAKGLAMVSRVRFAQAPPSAGSADAPQAAFGGADDPFELGAPATIAGEPLNVARGVDLTGLWLATQPNRQEKLVRTRTERVTLIDSRNNVQSQHQAEYQVFAVGRGGDRRTLLAWTGAKRLLGRGTIAPQGAYLFEVRGDRLVEQTAKVSSRGVRSVGTALVWRRDR